MEFKTRRKLCPGCRKTLDDFLARLRRKETVLSEISITREALEILTHEQTCALRGIAGQSNKVQVYVDFRFPKGCIGFFVHDKNTGFQAVGSIDASGQVGFVGSIDASGQVGFVGQCPKCRGALFPGWEDEPK